MQEQLRRFPDGGETTLICGPENMYLIDSFLAGQKLSKLKEYGVFQKGYSTPKIRNPAIKTARNLCTVCDRLMQADWMAPIVLYDDMQSLESKKKDCLLCNMMFVALKSRSAQRIHEVQDYEVWAFCGVSSPALKPLPSDEDELRAQVSKLRFDELVVGLRPRGGKQTEDLKEKRALDKLTAKLEVHEMPRDIEDALLFNEEERLQYPEFDRRVKLAKYWLQKCRTSHKKCRIADSDPLLPTRVLDLGKVGEKHATKNSAYSSEIEVKGDLAKVEDVGQDVFLFESDGTRAQYVALSHCWGGSETLKTTLGTYVARKNRISLSTVPKTFRDAIEVTRSLGIRYLWIDSLCIIQDSPVDWAQESNNMGSIYRNAVITIAAVDSPDSDSGMLPARGTSDTYSPCLIGESVFSRGSEEETSARLYAEMPDSVHFGGHEENIDSYRRRGHLDGRGWALQEEVLSRRTLAFTEVGMFWECMHLGASEGLPQGFTRKADPGHRLDRFYKKGFEASLRGAPEEAQEEEQPTNKYDTWLLYEVFRAMMRDEEDFHDKNSVKATVLDSGPRNLSCVGIDQSWRSLVKNYSQRQLTRQTDMLIALQGIVNIITERTGWRFLAGLWQENLHADLLWHINPGELQAEYDKGLEEIGLLKATKIVRPRPKPPFKRVEVEAPSWTWVTRRQPVEFEASSLTGNLSPLMEIQNVELQRVSHYSIHGRLEVSSVALKAVVKRGVDGERDVLHDPEDEELESIIYYTDDDDWSDPNVICVAVSENLEAENAKHDRVTYCLVLKPVAEAQDHPLRRSGDVFWRRAGLAVWDSKDWNMLAWLQPVEQGGSTTSKVQFIIV